MQMHLLTLTKKREKKILIFILIKPNENYFHFCTQPQYLKKRRIETRSCSSYMWALYVIVSSHRSSVKPCKDITHVLLIVLDSLFSNVSFWSRRLVSGRYRSQFGKHSFEKHQFNFIGSSTRPDKRWHLSRRCPCLCF